ncbi:hypothetical protein TAO_0190 [Candidatus Nitrosoglobus terrae]|uniref:Uncharacterized protein n=1 Tax=Candidatus Nitrosoglobus terrae TaxID=1630141 RepID=A0A1Q2SKB8_9GAMM|nr:hypothetical protein TAO_0190 [Candidatus Nitrosoglobus terrae]
MKKIFALSRKQLLFFIVVLGLFIAILSTRTLIPGTDADTDRGAATVKQDSVW